MSEDLNRRIATDPRFVELQRRRGRYAVTLSVIMLAIYYGYILIVAFWPGFLATPLGAGTTMTIGFPIGVGVIVAAIVLTGLYVRRANTEFDRITQQLIREA
jgi:uncharacterized membrane protein (DUF485 family)